MDLLPFHPIRYFIICMMLSYIYNKLLHMGMDIFDIEINTLTAIMITSFLTVWTLIRGSSDK